MKAIGVFVAATLDRQSTTSGRDARRDRAAALGMTVHLRHDHRAVARRLLERPTLRLGRLSDRAVEHHDGQVWLDRRRDLPHLVEEIGLLPMPARRVDDDDLEALLAELVDALPRDDDRIRLGVAAEEGHASFGGAERV